MSKIVFANGTELAALWVEKSSEYYDNANRQVLTVQVSPNAITLNKLDALLSKTENLAKLHHVNEENGAEDIFEHHQIKIELAKRPVVVRENEDGSQTTEELLVFKLARYTPIEIKLAQLGLL